MYLHCKLVVLFCLLLWGGAAFSQAPLPVKRAAPSILARDANVQGYQVVIIPVVPDTASALAYGVDSLGMLIQVRATGKQYKRDTVLTGGHVWTEIGSGGTGSSNTSVGGKIAIAITGTNNVKSVDTAWGTTLDSSHANIVKIGADSQSVASKKYVAQQRDSLGGVIGTKLAAISTANSVTGNGTPASPVQLAGDATSPGNSQYYGTNGSGAKGYYSLPSGVTSADPSNTIGFTPKNGSASTFMRSDAAQALDTVATLIRGDGFNQLKYKQIVDSNQSANSWASVGRVNKAKDSLVAILVAKLDSNQSIHSWASIGRINKIADSLSGLFIRAIDSNQSIHSWASIGRLNKVADSLSLIFLSTVSVTNSITGNGTSGTPLKLSGDAATPGANKTYGTDGSGVKGWKSDPAGGGGGAPGGSAKSVQIFSNNGTYFGSVPGFTADSLTHVVSMDSAAIHKAKLDSILFNRSMYFTPLAVCLLGDSYTAPTPVRPDGSTAYYFNIMNTRWGSLSVTNLASSGTGIFNAVAQFNKQSIPVSFLTSALVDLNDLRYNSTALTFNKIISGWSALYCIQYAATALAATGGTGITNSGTWVSKDYSSGTYGGRSTTGAYTITQNSSVTYTATLPSQGGSIYLMPMGGTTNYGGWDLLADTTLVMQGSSNQRSDGIQVSGHNDNFIPYSLIVEFNTGGSHSVTLKKTGATADTVGLDVAGVMKDSSAATPFLIWDQPLLDATGYATSPNQSNANIAAQINAVHDSLFQAWDHRYPVKHVLTNNFWNPINSLSVTDHIHPNNRGDINLANAGLSVLPFNDPSVYRTLMKMGRDRFDVLQDGRRRSWYWKDEAVSKADLAIYQYRASAGSINGTTNTVPLFTSSSTIGNSVITQSSSNIGIGQSSPTSVLDILTTNNGIRVKNANNAIGMALFSSSAAIWYNRDYSSGTINAGTLPASTVEFTNTGKINFWTGNGNGVAGVQNWSWFSGGHMAGGQSSPSDNTTSWGPNMVIRTDGGLWVNGINNAANHYNFVVQSNGQTVFANAGNTARFALQVDSNRNALRIGPNNSSNSYTSGYSYWDNATGDFYDSANLRTNGFGTFGNFTDNNGFLNVAANTTTRASIFLAGASADVSSPNNGMLWYNSTTDALNFRHGGTNTNLLAAGGSSPPFDDNTAIAKNHSDATKLLKLDLSAIATGTTRTWAWPDYNGTVAALDHDETFSATTLSVSNNLVFNTSTGHLNTGSAVFMNSVSVGSFMWDSTSSSSDVLGTGAGTSASLGANHGCGNIVGKIDIVTGSSPGASATVITITANCNYGDGVTPVILSPANAATAALSGNASVWADAGNTSIILHSGSTPLAASTEYKWNYIIVKHF